MEVKYYRRKQEGGYSPCILGNDKIIPRHSEMNTLPNCFSGNTKIITRNGVKELKDLVDKEIEVLSKDGVYRKAIGHCYGKQELYELEFRNGKKVLTTLNHRWLVIKKSHYNNKKYIKEDFVETKDLKMSKCYRIPFNKIENISIDRDGIINGCIYGDGSLYNEKKYSRMSLCGDKKEYLKEFFISSKHSCINSNGTIEYYPFPKELKSIPNLDNSLEYLKGFICGLIATDGCVSKSEVRISTSKEEDANKIYEICNVLGYQTKIRVENNHKSNFDNKIHTLYHIIPYIREEEMFLNPIHRKRIHNVINIDRSSTSPKSIKYFGVDNVYCVEEPETHTITLDGGILTGQCVSLVVGYFNELRQSNNCNLLGSVNANYMITIAKQQGLQVGSTPRPASAICWDNGDCGHTAIVRVKYKNGSIRVKESGWNGKSYTWEATLSGSNYTNGESWLNNGKYKLQGFIYQPLLKTMYCNATIGLNEREGAGTNYAKVGGYAYKSKVNIYAIEGNWGATENGWVCLDYLQNEPIQEKEPLPLTEEIIKEMETITDTTESVIDIEPYYEEKERNNSLLYLIQKLVELIKKLFKRP